VQGPAADVSLANTAAPSTPVLAGTNATVNFTATNVGGSTAQTTVVTAQLPPGVDPRSVVCSAPGCNCTFNATTVTCSVGDLAPGATATVSLVVSPSTSGNLTIPASVSAANDANPANNNAQAPIQAVRLDAGTEQGRRGARRAGRLAPGGRLSQAWLVAPSRLGDSPPRPG
jgi:hypothetical protein